MSDNVKHPKHYGGEDNPYEVIKVAEAWGFDKDAYLFNVLKYIGRPGKGAYLEDLKKALFYLERKISRIEAEQNEAKANSINTLTLKPPTPDRKRVLPFAPADEDLWGEPC